MDRIGGGGADFGQSQDQLGLGEGNSKYRGAQGLDPAFIASLEKQFGLDKPPLERFGLLMWNYVRFDFGKSYFRDISVIDLIKEKLPVSISLGLWMTLALLYDLDSARHPQGNQGRLDISIYGPAASSSSAMRSRAFSSASC